MKTEEIGEEEGWWLTRICPTISGVGRIEKCYGSRCTHWEQRAEKQPKEGNPIRVGLCIYGRK